MRLDVLSANIKVYYVHAGCIRRPEEGAGFSGAGVVGGRELPCGSWECYAGPLQDPPVLLTTERFPSLSSLLRFHINSDDPFTRIVGPGW